MRSFRLAVCLAAAVCLFCAPALGALSYDLRADNACFVREYGNQSQTNDQTWVTIRAAAPNRAYGLFQWTLSSVVSFNEFRIDNAEITLYFKGTQAGGPAHNLALEVPTDAWDEATATWVNKPGIDTATLDVSAPASTVQYDFSGPTLDALVADWLDGSAPNYGVYGLSTSPGIGTFMQVDGDNGSDESIYPRLTFDVVETPEPATMLMLALGTLGLLKRKRAA